jgi:uncharacterized glyoxalase superfamily protein PhnB
MSHLDAIGIVSRDPQKSLAFYRLLGVEFAGAGQGAPDHFEAVLPSGVRLMIDTEDMIKDLIPGWTRPNGSGVTLCFKQDHAKAVDELHHKVVKAGFASVREPWDAFWGQRYASVSDPDGNQIDLFAGL